MASVQELKSSLSGELLMHSLDIKDPQFGGPLHLTCRIPRLVPAYERPELTVEELSSMTLELLHWVELYFSVAGMEVYFKEACEAAILYASYVSPQAPLSSPQLSLTNKLMFWLWINDDEMEKAIEAKASFKDMQHRHKLLLNILEGHYDTGCIDIDVPEAFNFKAIFSSLLSLHLQMLKEIPNYGKCSERFRFYLKRYLDANVWCCSDIVDGRFSEETFCTYLKIVCFADGIVELISLVEGIDISNDVAHHPLVLRLIDIANYVGATTNDIMGIMRDFPSRIHDNLLVFKVLQKGQGLQDGVDSIVARITKELKDFVQLKQTLKKLFPNDLGVLGYVEILESMIDGNNKLYLQSNRHQAVGCFTLTR